MWRKCVIRGWCVISRWMTVHTMKEARCSTLSQAAGIANALAMSLYLPVFGPDIIIQKFAWVISCLFPLSVREHCETTNPVFLLGAPHLFTPAVTSDSVDHRKVPVLWFLLSSTSMVPQPTRQSARIRSASYRPWTTWRLPEIVSVSHITTYVQHNIEAVEIETGRCTFLPEFFSIPTTSIRIFGYITNYACKNFILLRFIIILKASSCQPSSTEPPVVPYTQQAEPMDMDTGENVVMPGNDVEDLEGMSTCFYEATRREICW